MKRVAFVVSRYGQEVVGGSELYVRRMAHKLKDTYRVEILTTTAISAETWENAYDTGTLEEEGVTVRRFPVEGQRDAALFQRLHEQVLRGTLPARKEPAFWQALGPVTPALLQYLEEQKDAYDLFFVVNYFSYLSLMALSLLGKRCVLIPHAHDQPYLYHQAMQQAFAAPRGLVFLTAQEQYLVQGLFPVRETPFGVLGVGVDLPQDISPGRFSTKHRVRQYLLYVGRVEDGKGCRTLLSYFSRYRDTYPEADIKLLFMGAETSPLPEHPEVLRLGFVKESEKFDGMAGALAVVMPSPHESLSLVVLESLAVGTPVLVSGQSAVLKAHCLESNAGLYFEGYETFEASVNFLRWHPSSYREMQENGKAYIQKNYRWETILHHFSQWITQLLSAAP